ncbi:Dynamitin-domain-containing protein [Amanita rubescens]|nr:Dynamitin-domain-containing protein [Amanita rubescens]
MNNKYADLPDIDTAPDIYETEDVFPTTQNTKGDSSDDEAGSRTGQHARNSRHGDGAGREELDTASLMRADEASKHFRKAERKQRGRSRMVYVYPPSRSSRLVLLRDLMPLSKRLYTLQKELAALEQELADPSNPLLQKEREENVDPGELIKGLVDVRGKIEKIRKDKQGRGKLIGAVMDDESSEVKETDCGAKEDKTTMKTFVDIDRRVGELERIIGSSSTALDEMAPMPYPLLPLMSRLNSQLMLLTQPRHVDSISRRLKLLLTDLDRLSLSQHHRRHSSQTPATPSLIQEQLLPILSRLNPTLPQIPHILTRLRTLSALHGAAGDFQSTLEGLEKEGAETRGALRDLQDALTKVEESMTENKTLIKQNRIDDLAHRLHSLNQ